jgi:hypothetical protein
VRHHRGIEAGLPDGTEHAAYPQRARPHRRVAARAQRRVAEDSGGDVKPQLKEPIGVGTARRGDARVRLRDGKADAGKVVERLSAERCRGRWREFAALLFKGFWCIWGFWTGEDSLVDRRPTDGKVQMPYFKPFPVADVSDRRRVGGCGRTVVRRCTRTVRRVIVVPLLIHGVLVNPTKARSPIH